MNKTELIKRIIDTFTDMGSEDPVDTAVCNPLTLDEAKTYLAERRAFEKTDLEPDEWLPAEVTPELYMEATNCYIKKCRHDVTAQRLAEFIQLHEQVNLYHEFDGEYVSNTDKIVYHTDFLTEDMEFPFTSENLSMLELIAIGQNSPDFICDSEFCWYDTRNEQLHSTDTPFADGLIDARAFAEWILESDERIAFVKDSYMINTDIDYIFRAYM